VIPISEQIWRNFLLFFFGFHFRFTAEEEDTTTNETMPMLKTMIDVEGTEELREFERWAGVDDPSSLVKIARFLRSNPENPQDDPFYVRGLGTTRAVSAGEVLCSISADKMIFLTEVSAIPLISSVLERAKLPNLAPADDEELNVIGAIAPVVLYLLMNSSRYDIDSCPEGFTGFKKEFESYVNILPQEYDLTECWSEEELMSLEGSSLFAATRQRQQDIWASYSLLQPALVEMGWNLTYEDYIWANCAVISRFDFFLLLLLLLLPSFLYL